jgi:hypothetical protein
MLTKGGKLFPAEGKAGRAVDFLRKGFHGAVGRPLMLKAAMRAFERVAALFYR